MAAATAGGQTGLCGILSRVVPPRPWAEGENLPWHEPAFSERMLQEHLSQAHDLASRRSETIERQVAAIAALLPRDEGCRVLDLTCGPGLYCHQLARRGHSCHGIDISPAAIRHARAAAAAEGLAATYAEGDVRQTEFGSGYDLALFLYGQINVFRRDEARNILERAGAALGPSGRIVVEAQAETAVGSLGRQPPTWSTAGSGVFSDAPHLLLEESGWDEASRTATERWYVVDAATGAVESHAMSTVAYGEDELASMLTAAGFGDVEARASLGPDVDPSLFVLVGSR